jgi:hypothetical protein
MNIDNITVIKRDTRYPRYTSGRFRGEVKINITLLFSMSLPRMDDPYINGIKRRKNVSTKISSIPEKASASISSPCELA